MRATAGGLRYVLYVFMTDLADPSRVIHAPGGYFLAAEGEERFGDTAGNVFCCGAVARENGDVLLYYGGADTRVYVAKSSIERLVDYAVNTPPDALSSSGSVRQRMELIAKNARLIDESDDQLLKRLLDA